MKAVLQAPACRCPDSCAGSCHTPAGGRARQGASTMSGAAPGEGGGSGAAGPSGSGSAGAGAGNHTSAPEPAAQAGAGGSRGAAADLKGWGQGGGPGAHKAGSRFRLPSELMPLAQPAIVVPVPPEIPTQGGTSRCGGGVSAHARAPVHGMRCPGVSM